MNYLKALGLAAVAAMAVMAFGANGASAAKICVGGTPSGQGCPTTSETVFQDGTHQILGATSTNPVLTSSIATVTCENSSTSVAPNSGEGEPITGEITALTFSGNCKTGGGTACTVTTVNLPYPASLTSSALTVNDATGAGAKVVCGVLINCTFTTKHAELSVKHTKFQATVQLERTGGFCPATAEWHATYTVADETTIL